MFDQFEVYEPRPRAEAASGVLVSTRWELQARPGGSVKARFVAREFATTVRPDLFAPATSAISAAVMDTLALMHGWSRAAVDATSAYMQADENELAFVEHPADCLESWVHGGGDAERYSRAGGRPAG